MNMEEKNKPTKKSERNTKSVKVAIFCITAIVIFYFGTNFLKGVDSFSKRDYYYSVYENSGGLYVGAIVYLQGYQIGKVTKVKLVSSSPVQILTEYIINEKIDIPKDSRFDVTSRDMLGGTIVRLSLGTETQLAKSGDTLACGIIPPMTEGLESMKGQLSNILSSIDTVAVSLKNALSADKLAKTMVNIESVTSSLDHILAKNETNFGKIVTQIAQFSETLNEVSPDLKRIVSNFDQIADTLAKANLAEVIVNVNNTLVQIEETVRKINTGDGDVAKLLNEDELYIKLGNSLLSLDELLIDIKKNPKKYINVTVFGKKEKK